MDPCKSMLGSPASRATATIPDINTRVGHEEMFSVATIQLGSLIVKCSVHTVYKSMPDGYIDDNRNNIQDDVATGAACGPE